MTKRLLLAGAVVCASAVAAPKYEKPEEMIDKLVRAESFSSPSFNPQKTAVIKAFFQETPSIKYVARPKLRLAGTRFNPSNYTTISNYYATRVTYFDLKTRKERPIAFPKESILREIKWSPDGKRVVISSEKENCHELWIIETPSLALSKIPGVCLNAVLGRTVHWMSANELLIGARTPAQSKPVRVDTAAPTGPVILETKGTVAQNRTYADLLKSPQDENTFARAAESQLVKYNTKTKAKTNVGKPAIFMNATPSPNGKLVLVERIQRPFSYSVPYYYFAGDAQVWDSRGKLIYEITKGGPFENIPIQGVKTGPRHPYWVESQPQTVFWVEALDKGDWAVKVDHRDELFMMKIPENGKPAPESVLKIKNRFAELNFLDDMEIFWVSDYERDKEWITSSLLYKKDGKWITREVFSLSENDDYKKPGEPVHVRNKFGRAVIAVDKKEPASIFFSGPGATPEGDRPFLMRMDLASLARTEIFRSEKGSYESFETFANPDFSAFYTNYETQTVSPRLDLRKEQDGKLTRETVYADPNPYAIMAKIKKEIITYKRADGVMLSGVLYYPLDYKKGVKYPAVISAYPLEYTDASVAGQVRGSPDRFEKPFREAVVYNALRGYVVLDDAQMPIIGHPETKNDTFIEQLVSGAKAAVDTLKSRDLIDTKRVGVIGHSYGAFMVAHLLTHSDLFAAGVAKSGAYNRTLTPFGFQGERRPFWKAKPTYTKLSPFFDAEKMKKPMLLMHGMADNNSGTFTMQSERYFDALKGQGANARLVLLPEESHGYASVESIEHVLFEIFNWYDKYLKNAEVK